MTPSNAASHRSSDELPLHDLLRAIRRRMVVVVGVAVAIASLVLAFSLNAEKQYTATAKLLFRDPGFDQRLFGSSILAPSQDPDREAATNVGLVSLDTITERTASQLRGSGLTPAAITAKVDVTSEGRSNVVAVMATDRRPIFAAKLANTMAEQYIEFRRAADRSKITDAVSLVRRQLDALSPRQRAGPDGRSAKERVEQLEILASLQTGNAELVQPARAPRTASSPTPVRNTIIASLLGLLIGVLFAMLLDRVDRRLRTRNDAEAIMDRPVLGAIPESRGLRNTQQPSLQLGGAEGEAFRALQTNLRYFAIDQDVKSMLITSSAPGDGKSTVARYLAGTAAASNVRVVLLEADLRRPTLNRAFKHLSQRGLTDILAGTLPLSEVIQQVPLTVSSQMGSSHELGKRTLDVIPAGPIPPNPTDLLESDRMLDIITELESLYDLVIIDSSPITVVPDAVSLANRVSGVAVVIREGKSTSTGVRHLRKQLDNLQIAPLGIILNASSPAEEGGYYAYYGHSSPEQNAVPADSSDRSGAPGRLSRRNREKTGAR